VAGDSVPGEPRGRSAPALPGKAASGRHPLRPPGCGWPAAVRGL